MMRLLTRCRRGGRTRQGYLALVRLQNARDRSSSGNSGDKTGEHERRKFRETGSSVVDMAKRINRASTQARESAGVARWRIA